jgi:hypothetical protein
MELIFWTGLAVYTIHWMFFRDHELEDEFEP